MKNIFISLLLSLTSLAVFAQESEVVTRDQLRAESEAYRDQVRRERLERLEGLYPISTPGVIVTNAGNLLGSRVANLKVVNTASHTLNSEPDLDCQNPGLLERFNIYQLKRNARRSARNAAETAAAEALSEACREIGGRLNTAEIRFKEIERKIDQRNVATNEGDYLQVEASWKTEASGLCDRIGE